MIIIKTPLRISLGGGGTDLPSYYSKFGSYFISAAINKYIYITLHRSGFSDKIRCRYSKMEEVDDIDKIKNEIIRETFKYCGIKNNIELTSHAEIPSGTGLGSSGSFGVGLLQAIYTQQKIYKDWRELAEIATDIQMNILNHPIGLQDQYIASFGGICEFKVNQNGKVLITELKIKKQIHDRLIMFFTGFSRKAEDILKIQKIKIEKADKEMINNLHQIQNLAYEVKLAFYKDDWQGFGEIMNEQWRLKRGRSDKMTNSQIDKWHSLALKNGAVGGKLIGAGGGGFLLFIADDKEKLIKTMIKAGLKYLPFAFDDEGSKIILND